MSTFLNRDRELERLRRAFQDRARLVVVYGRRRLGKTRLLVEAVGTANSVVYSADLREAALQRDALARAIASVVPGFDGPRYADWDILFGQLYRTAPAGMVLAIDEFPYLVSSSPELPSVLQKHLDRGGAHLTLALCGSSQALMHGLALDATAPLYGRASELLRLGPMSIDWMAVSLGLDSPVEAVHHWSVWGGVPRYWELAQGRPFWEAVSDRILDPTGPLHHEPDRLLRDDLPDPTRASSVLALIGRGCHRLSEIAARLGVPATDLSRTLGKLVELGLVTREVPFGRTLRDTKRTLYRIGDSFLSFWFRFVDPNRSRLETGRLSRVVEDVERDFPLHLGSAWESLVRAAVPLSTFAGQEYRSTSRWWGSTRQGPVELDVVAEPEDPGGAVLVGEVKLRVTPTELNAVLARLERIAPLVPELAGRRTIPVVFVLEPSAELEARPEVFGAHDVVEAFRGR